jgi:uncharacterized membrane protein
MEEHPVPWQRRASMATLTAIGYPDETAAPAANEEAGQLAEDLIIQLDAIAVAQHVTTDKALVAWSEYDGIVLQFSLSHDDEQRLQEALHGSQPVAQT